MNDDRKIEQASADTGNPEDASGKKRLDIQQTTLFKKGFKRMRSRGADLGMLKSVLNTLCAGEELDEKYRDHQLDGKWKSSRDCHIQPDWVLIYRLTDDALILEATGSHSDIFRT
jgi:mRNA interferase YafQ